MKNWFKALALVLGATIVISASALVVVFGFAWVAYALVIHPAVAMGVLVAMVLIAMTVGLKRELDRNDAWASDPNNVGLDILNDE